MVQLLSLRFGGYKGEYQFNLCLWMNSELRALLT